MNKKSILLVVFISFCLIFTSCTKKPEQTQEKIEPQKSEPTVEKTYLGKIVFLKGHVLLDSTVAKINMPIKNGAHITTGDTATVDIVFEDKNIIRIYENTRTVLNLESEEKKVILNKGALANIIKKLTNLAGKQDQFSISTPVGVAAVRGTSFFVNAEDSTQTYICCCNGEIQVSNPDGSEPQILEAAHHKALHCTRQGQHAVWQGAELKYHSDEDMETIAEKVGVESIGRLLIKRLNKKEKVAVRTKNVAFYMEATFFYFV